MRLRKITCSGLLLLCGVVFMNCSVDSEIHQADWGYTELSSFNRPFNAPPDSNIVMASDFSSQVPGSNGHGCPVPNELSLARQVKEADEARFRRGSELNWVRASNGPRSVSLTDSRWTYMDAVVAELRKKDKRWGYTCVWGNCNDPSTDAIAYWCGQGDPGDSTNVGTVDIITGSHNVAWQIHWKNAQDTDNQARWTYPRPGKTTPPESTGPSNSGFDPSTFSWDKVTFLSGGGLANQNISGWAETSKITSFSMARRKGICIDHTQKNNWKDEFTHDGKTWVTQGNPWVFVYKDGKIYAATYEHLRPIGHNHGRGHGQICKLSHLGSLKDILAGIGSHAKLSPVKEWMPKPGEIVGFAVSTHARYGYKLTQERSDIVWVKIPDYNSVNSGGEIVGRTSGGSTNSDTDGGGNNNGSQKGQCSTTPNTCISGVHHPHPKDTLTEYRWTCRNVPHRTGEIRCKASRTTDNCGPAPHYVAVNGRCLPSCGALAHAKGVGKTDHQLQPAPTCRTGWTRLGDSKEQAQHGNSVCCQRNSTTTE